jgi:type IV secretion system protein VirB5
MKFRIIVAALLTATFFCSTAANAQFGGIVFDPTNYANAVSELAQLQQQLSQLQMANQQLTQTYQAIAHLPSNTLNQLSSTFNINEFRNPLQTSNTDIGNMMNGNGLGSGALGSAASGFAQQNHIFTLRDGSALDKQMQSEATGVAATQATASTLYQSAVDHVTALQSLETQLSQTKDAKETADIQARIELEHAYISAQLVQLQSLALWQTAQERNAAERQQEQSSQSISNAISAGGN